MNTKPFHNVYDRKILIQQYSFRKCCFNLGNIFQTRSLCLSVSHYRSAAFFHIQTFCCKFYYTTYTYLYIYKVVPMLN
jgi:hypothetical protein